MQAIRRYFNRTVSEFYSDCRNIGNNWIWDPAHTLKLGGVEAIVEMDESYFPGQPKYNQGRRLGKTWEEDNKWTFGLTSRDGLDCIFKQVLSGRSTKDLLPIINKHCLDGIVFLLRQLEGIFQIGRTFGAQGCFAFSCEPHRTLG